MEIIEKIQRLPVIKTKRLILKEIKVSDISQEYIDWLNNPDINKYLEIRFFPQTLETVKQYIESKLSDTVNTKHFGIFDNNGKRLVGSVTIPHIDWNHLSGDISFVIGYPDTQGRGYGTEAVHAVCYYMFMNCGLKKLWGGYYDGHTASEKIFFKNGFSIEGRIKGKLINYLNKRVDWIVAGLLIHEFKAEEKLLGQLPFQKSFIPSKQE
jgi:[ribosomal protein S5]-alanine N-acetyltransferase